MKVSKNIKRTPFHTILITVAALGFTVALAGCKSSTEDQSVTETPSSAPAGAAASQSGPPPQALEAQKMSDKMGQDAIERQGRAMAAQQAQTPAGK